MLITGCRGSRATNVVGGTDRWPQTVSAIRGRQPSCELRYASRDADPGDGGRHYECASNGVMQGHDSLTDAGVSRMSRYALQHAAIPLGLFLFSLILHIAVTGVAVGFTTLESGSDEEEYFQRALLLYEHQRFDGLLRTPLWPAMLAGLWLLTGPSIVAGKILNALLGALIPVGVYFLCKGWLGRRSSVVAALLVALLPTLLAIDATLYSETPANVGFIWTNVLLMRAVRCTLSSADRPAMFRPGYWIAFGVAVALVNLIKPAYVLWLVFLVILGSWRYRRMFLKWMGAVLVSILAFCLVMGPWWIRNAHASGGHFVPFSLAGDLSFLESNSPGVAAMKPRIEEVDGRKIWIGPGKYLLDLEASGLLTYAELAPLDEVQQAALARNRALHWMATNPWSWLALVVKKLGYGFGVWPLWQGSWRTLCVGLPFVVISILSLPGWYHLLRTPGPHRLLLLHPLCFLATTILFFGSLRYRSAYEPSFVIAAVVGLSLSWKRRQAHDRLVRNPETDVADDDPACGAGTPSGEHLR